MGTPHKPRTSQLYPATARALAGVTALLLVAGAVRSTDALQDRSGASSAGAWVTAWATSQQALAETGITNATVRLIARVTIPGDAVRIRLDNSFGQDSVKIGRAFVGIRVQGALLAAGSNKPVTFGQSAEVILPPGGTVWSDPVPLQVLAQQDLAISLFMPGSNVKPSQHTGRGGHLIPYRRWRRRYRSRRGPDRLFGHTDLHLVAEGDRRAIDVIFRRNCGVRRFNHRRHLHDAGRPRPVGRRPVGAPWAAARCGDGAARRLVARLESRRERGYRRKHGDPTRTVTGPRQPAGIERVERDVLSHHGVTDVILFMGTNDIRRGASADAVERGLASIIERVKAKGIRISAVTIIPRHNVAPSGTNTGWSAEKTRIRNDVNEWIRSKAAVDDVIDFDKVMRDSVDANLMAAPFNCGDGIHPSPAGYYALGRSVPLTLFADRSSQK